MIDVLRRVPGYLRRRVARLLPRTAPAAAPAAPPAPYRRALTEMGPDLTTVVLVVRRGGLRLAAELAETHPAATVHLLAGQPVSAKRRADLPDNVLYAHCPDLATRLRRLARFPQPQLIIERGLEHTGERVDTFRSLIGLVARSGRYVVDSVPASDAPQEALDEQLRLTQLLADLARTAAGQTPGEHADQVELSRSIGPVETLPGGWIIVKQLSHQWKIRDRRANRLLEARFGSEWGEVIATKPATTVASRARAVGHGEGLRTFRPEFAVPDRWLRRYHLPTCYARQRVRLGDYWLPDTFRNVKLRLLYNHQLLSTGPEMARAAGEQETPTRTLEGAFYYFDSEYYSHFGHVLTEVTARTWGWPLARKLAPELRPLVSLPDDRPTIPGFQRQIFAALDIDPDSVEYVRPGAGVRVEELYGCTPDWDMPRYCAPELVDVWERIRVSCMNHDLTATPELLFISRRPRGIRTCLNTEEVDRFFARLGFTILYPEDLTFSDQIATFAGARVIAGFAGSGMFNAMFAPSATVLVLTGASYTAMNEYLIKSLVGGDIHYFWSPALHQHPPGGWTREAFRSNYVFDLERFGPEIVEVVTAATG